MLASSQGRQDKLCAQFRHRFDQIHHRLVLGRFVARPAVLRIVVQPVVPFHLSTVESNRRCRPRRTLCRVHELRGLHKRKRSSLQELAQLVLPHLSRLMQRSGYRVRGDRHRRAHPLRQVLRPLVEA